MLDREPQVQPRRRPHPFYAPEEPLLGRGEIRCILRDPNGTELDLTRRLNLDTLVTHEILEEDLSFLAHGDVELELQDPDGVLERFLEGAREDEEWTVVIERELFRRRQKWETVFAGILDLPWSYVRDPKLRTVTLQVFSYSKVLENTSAEGVRRSFSTLRGSVTAATQLVNLTTGTTAGIEPGDEILLDDGEIREKQTVLQLNSSTQIVTEVNWVNAFTDQVLTIETPFHRDRSVEFLVGELFLAAGIRNYRINIRNPLNEILFPSSMSRRGLKSGELDYLIDKGGKMQVKREGDTQIWSQLAPADGWATDGSGAQRWMDWRINRLDEPPNFVDHAGNSSFDGPADQVGVLAADRHYYHLIQYPAVEQLWLRRDGADFRQLEGTFTINNPGTGATLGGLSESTDFVWYSYKKDSGDKALKYHRLGANDVITVGSGGGTSEWFGQHQVLRALGLNVFLPHFGGDASTNFLNAEIGQLHIYPDPVGANPPPLLGKVQVPSRLKVESLRSFRHPQIGNVVGGLYYTSDTTKMRIWRVDAAASWTQIADFTLVDEDTDQDFGGDDDNWLTVFDHNRNDPVNKETIFLAAIRNPKAGGKVPWLFAVSAHFVGVVPYADFEGMSAAEALRELAVATLSIVTVDYHRIGTFLGRAQRGIEDASGPIEIPAPLERETRPIWEFYRTSVEVSGETVDGGTVKAVAGAAGASARRLTLSSKFVTSEALASGIAQQYLGHVGLRRSEEEILIAEVDPTIHVLNTVRMDGREYLVTEASHDVLGREQELRMFELSPP